MADLLSVGGGASSGLDTYLNRLLVQQQLAEKERSDRATEADRQTALEQNNWVKNSLAEEHDARVAAVHAAAAEDERKRLGRQAYIADETKPQILRDYFAAEDIMPTGKLMPFELYQANAGKTIPPGPVHELDDNTLARINPDNTTTPIMAPRPAGMENVQGPTAPGTTNPPPPRPAKAFHQPDRVLIQTGDGYMPRDKARATLAAGGDVPLATTSSTRTMQEGAKMMMPLADEVYKDAETLEKMNLFGPMMGRVRDLATKLGTVQGLESTDLDAQQAAMKRLGEAVASDPGMAADELSGKFAAELGFLMTGMGRVHGGARGGGSPQMLEHFKGLLTSSSTLPLFRGRILASKNLLSHYAAGPAGMKQEQAVDPYQEYLDRTQKRQDDE